MSKPFQIGRLARWLARLVAWSEGGTVEAIAAALFEAEDEVDKGAEATDGALANAAKLARYMLRHSRAS